MKLPHLLSFAEKIINRIESLKISTFFLTLYIFFLISVREILEQLSFEKSYSIYQFMHHFFFAILVIMVGIFIISLIGRINLIKVTLIVSSGLFLIIFPPLIDRFIFQRTIPYEYILPGEFLKNFSTFFLLTPKAGLGIMIEIASIIVLSSFYVLIKSRSLLRAIVTGLSIYLLVGMSATPRLILPIPSVRDFQIWNSRHIIYFSFYFVLSIFVGFHFLFRINRSLPKALIKELISFRTLHFILMVSVGIYFNKTLAITVLPDYLYMAISVVLITMVWLSTVLINNVYDLEIDRVSNPNRPLARAEVSPKTYLSISCVLSAFSIYVSSVLGAIPFILTILFLLSSLAYSIPPLRLRKRLFSTLFIGWGSCLAFFIGYFNHIYITDLSIDRDAIVLSIIIFIAFSIGPMTKDLKDYYSDLQQGVRTFFTIYGLNKGTQIVAVLLGVSLLIPIFLFHTLVDILFIGFISLLTSVLFYLKRNLSTSYLGYGIVFSYCAFRVLGIV